MAKRITTMRPRIATVDTRRVQPAPKQADPFYSSADWRALCEQLKTDRWPWLILEKGHCCEDPQCQAKHWVGMRIYFDHIVELRDGGAPLDPANIMGRCGSSHTRKTLAERARRLGA